MRNLPVIRRYGREWEWGSANVWDKAPEFFDFSAENWVDRLCPDGYNQSIVAKSLNRGFLAFQKTNQFVFLLVSRGL